jgi:hypothetical protein
MQSATLSTSAPPRLPPSDSEPRRLAPTDIAESIAAIRDTYSRDTSAAGVCVADGMGLRLSVERGALVVTDGIGGSLPHAALRQGNPRPTSGRDHGHDGHGLDRCPALVLSPRDRGHRACARRHCPARFHAAAHGRRPTSPYPGARRW